MTIDILVARLSEFAREGIEKREDEGAACDIVRSTRCTRTIPCGDDHLRSQNDGGPRNIKLPWSVGHALARLHCTMDDLGHGAAALDRGHLRRLPGGGVHPGIELTRCREYSRGLAQRGEHLRGLQRLGDDPFGIGFHAHHIGPGQAGGR